MEEKNMLNDKICKKREELNKSIEEKRDYSEIYKISVELDELIAEYYKNQNNQKHKKVITFYASKIKLKQNIPYKQ